MPVTNKKQLILAISVGFGLVLLAPLSGIFLGIYKNPSVRVVGVDLPKSTSMDFIGRVTLANVAMTPTRIYTEPAGCKLRKVGTVTDLRAFGMATIDVAFHPDLARDSGRSVSTISWSYGHGLDQILVQAGTPK